MAEPKPSVDDLVRVLTPTAIEVRPTGEAYSPFPVYDHAAAADVLRQVSKWLDAGAYDVVIGERHRELLDPRPLDSLPITLESIPQRDGDQARWNVTGLDSLLYVYLDNCPGGVVADDTASLLMEILSREQDASFIEANGLKKMAYSIVLGHEGMLGFWYGRESKVHKVSDDRALRGVYKLRKNETLWAPLIASSLAQERDAADRNLGLFADSLKVLDPLFFE